MIKVLEPRYNAHSHEQSVCCAALCKGEQSLILIDSVKVLHPQINDTKVIFYILFS